LSTKMKSVGEVMAIGRTFAEALGKAYRALERPEFELGADGLTPSSATLLEQLGTPTEHRLLLVEEALSRGHSVEAVAEASGIDPWFVDQIALAAECGAAHSRRSLGEFSAEELRGAKRAGIADRRIARWTNSTEEEVRDARHRLGVTPVFKTVDTCAGEFAARTTY